MIYTNTADAWLINVLSSVRVPSKRTTVDHSRSAKFTASHNVATTPIVAPGNLSVTFWTRSSRSARMQADTLFVLVGVVLVQLDCKSRAMLSTRRKLPAVLSNGTCLRYTRRSRQKSILLRHFAFAFVQLNPKYSTSPCHAQLAASMSSTRCALVFSEQNRRDK